VGRAGGVGNARRRSGRVEASVRKKRRWAACRGRREEDKLAGRGHCAEEKKQGGSCDPLLHDRSRIY
jgi:hypothetical protein